MCVNALEMNNSCDVTVMVAGTEAKICQFTTIMASKAYSCTLPECPETVFLVLAYDEGYHSEPAVTEMFVTPKLDYTPTYS